MVSHFLWLTPGGGNGSLKLPWWGTFRRQETKRRIRQIRVDREFRVHISSSSGDPSDPALLLIAYTMHWHKVSEMDRKLNKKDWRSAQRCAVLANSFWERLWWIFSWDELDSAPGPGKFNLIWLQNKAMIVNRCNLDIQHGCGETAEDRLELQLLLSIIEFHSCKSEQCCLKLTNLLQPCKNRTNCTNVEDHPSKSIRDSLRWKIHCDNMR